MDNSGLKKLSDELTHDISLLEDVLKTYEEERQALERLKSEEAEMLEALDAKDPVALESIMKFFKA